MTKAEAQRLIRMGSTAPAGYHLIGRRRIRAGHTAERFWDWGVDLFTPDGSRVLVRSAQEWRRHGPDDHWPWAIPQNRHDGKRPWSADHGRGQGA